MVYDNKPSYGDGQWHCPFPKGWVERMKQAAKHCALMSPEHIEAFLNNEIIKYNLPPGDFLSEPQDSRGLPLSLCEKYEKKYRDYPSCCMATYDYDSVPEIVVTNGADDWPYLSQTKTIYL